VIRVIPAPEPTDFDERVRRPGFAWLQKRGLPANGPAPRGVQPEPYWRDCLRQLHRAYGGHCAYLAYYIEPTVSQSSVDHFVPKSRRLELAYEWANYRLASGKINARKGDFDDVLDPFEIDEGAFELDLLTGAIQPSPRLRAAVRQAADATIRRLRLDDHECRGLRRKLFWQYAGEEINVDVLRHYSPFVWSEAQRQHLL
jgi:uncharacterized protein (TIGR02646 family)